MNKNKLVEYIGGEYGCKEDFPFDKFPEISVFRHNDNKKWFVIFMEIEAEKLGIKSKGKVWTVGVKCDVLLRNSFLQEKGVYPSYHMNKNHWLSIVLDEVDEQILKTLIDISFDITKKKYKTKKSA